MIKKENPKLLFQTNPIKVDYELQAPERACCLYERSQAISLFSLYKIKILTREIKHYLSSLKYTLIFTYERITLLYSLLNAVIQSEILHASKTWYEL